MTQRPLITLIEVLEKLQDKLEEAEDFLSELLIVEQREECSSAEGRRYQNFTGPRNKTVKILWCGAFPDQQATDQSVF